MLNEREVVISANYNDYISFADYAIPNFYEHFAFSCSFVCSFHLFVLHCRVAFYLKIWFKIYVS